MPVSISTGIENNNRPLRNLCTGEDKVTGWAFSVKTQIKIMCLKIKRTFRNDTTCHWKEGAVFALLE